MKFPVDAPKYVNARPLQPCVDGELEAEGPVQPGIANAVATSHAAVNSVTGTVIALRILQIGLKDAQTYVNPSMTVLVTDGNDRVIDSHDTQIASERRVMHVLFNETVYLNVSLEECQRM